MPTTCSVAQSAQGCTRLVRESVCDADNPDGYRRLLEGFSQAGYRAVSFAAFEPSATQVILRHDVDLSLDLAVQMCRLEADLGFAATYFVLLSTQFYNASSRNGRTALREMVALGHEVGLHFDPVACVGAETPEEMEAAAVEECERLENIVGRAVRVTAVHRPGTMSPAFLGMPGPYAKRMHAYEPHFFSAAGYVSESAGDWSHGHPFDHPSFANRTGMQLLTHPYLWMQAGLTTQREKIDRAVSGNQQAMWAELPNNFRSY